jgi:thioredoxin-like negative regulator of GroEL
LDKNFDFFIDIYADWCGPCINLAPYINQAAHILSSTIPTIKIGKFDTDRNDINRKLFPETSIPNVKFFPMNEKNKPIKYEGARDCSGIIQFLIENSSSKITKEVQEEVLKKAKKYDESKDYLDAVKRDLKSLEELVQVMDDMKKEYDQEIKTRISEMNELLAKDTEIEQLQTQFENVQKSFKKIEEIAMKAKEEQEYINLKNVKKIKSSEEYSNYLKNEKRIICVYFTAVNI